MTPDQARQTVRAALLTIAPDAEPDAVAPDADLREEFDLDSLDFQAFVAQVGKAAGIDISDDESRRLTTMNAWVTFLVRARRPVG